MGAGNLVFLVGKCYVDCYSHLKQDQEDSGNLKTEVVGTYKRDKSTNSSTRLFC